MKPFDGTVAPGKSGEYPFLRADTLLYEEEESVTHRFDCNTVGPVPAASGYGSRTLTRSAVHVLDSSKDKASALSSKHEKIHTQFVNDDLRESLETGIGDPKRSPTIDPLVGRSDANVCGTQILHFTFGSYFMKVLFIFWILLSLFCFYIFRPYTLNMGKAK